MVLKNHSGYRLDDCRLLAGPYNRLIGELSSIPGSERAQLRRLRMISRWLLDASTSAFESDPAEEALAVVDGFWERRRNGARGDDE